MLRLLVLLLVLGNAGYFVWNRGLLSDYGLGPATQSEPQRLMQQLRPDAVRLVPPAAELGSTDGGVPALPTGMTALLPASALTPALGLASTALRTTGAAQPAECLQAGLFNEAQTAVLRARLQTALPPGSWVIESSLEPARWMVYMGKYSSPDAVAKKKSELRQLRVPFEALDNAELEPGLSLGSFSSQTQALLEMARIAKRGVRTAKVIQTLAESRGQRLRLPAVDAALRPQLDAVQPQLAGKALQACH